MNFAIVFVPEAEFKRWVAAERRFPFTTLAILPVAER